MATPIEKNLFEKIVKGTFPFKDEDVAFMYEVYSLAVSSTEDLKEEYILNTTPYINHNEIIFYTIGEFLYSISFRSEEEKAAFIKEEKYLNSMASVILDKYLSLSMFRYKERQLGNPFSPPISSMNLYLNLMLQILQGYQKNDPKTTLVTDLLIKSVSISQCISRLLSDGYETEAFASWRTLHECECTLILLAKYPEVIDVYLKHMTYGMIFRKGHSDTPEEEKFFNQMKEEMKAHELKSKDIKKYIEYGWLYALPDAPSDLKLNFRDGLEKMAGLSMYNQTYDVSSEIIHSTPMLIYSNKNYYYFITLLSLYESFFRLEKVFMELFAKHVPPEYLGHYFAIKNVYYAQLVDIHKRELNNFKVWQKRNQK